MPSYKEMYLKMFSANEKAIDVLISAQRECEELYVDQPEAEIKLITLVVKGTEME